MDSSISVAFGVFFGILSFVVFIGLLYGIVGALVDVIDWIAGSVEQAWRKASGK